MILISVIPLYPIGYKGKYKMTMTIICLFIIRHIRIISCNETSFQKDFAILEQRYIVDRKIEIITNYSVWIYKLFYLF
jgi:hypothetical protein